MRIIQGKVWSKLYYQVPFKSMALIIRGGSCMGSRVTIDRRIDAIVRYILLISDDDDEMITLWNIIHVQWS